MLFSTLIYVVVKDHDGVILGEYRIAHIQDSLDDLKDDILYTCISEVYEWMISGADVHLKIDPVEQIAA